MNPYISQAGNHPHPSTDAASGAPLVIENLDVATDQGGVLFTVTYTLSVPTTADFVA